MKLLLWCVALCMCAGLVLGLTGSARCATTSCADAVAGVPWTELNPSLGGDAVVLVQTTGLPEAPVAVPSSQAVTHSSWWYLVAATRVMWLSTGYHQRPGGGAIGAEWARIDDGQVGLALSPHSGLAERRPTQLDPSYAFSQASFVLRDPEWIIAQARALPWGRAEWQDGVTFDGQPASALVVGRDVTDPCLLPDDSIHSWDMTHYYTPDHGMILGWEDMSGPDTRTGIPRRTAIHRVSIVRDHPSFDLQDHVLTPGVAVTVEPEPQPEFPVPDEEVAPRLERLAQIRAHHARYADSVVNDPRYVAGAHLLLELTDADLAVIARDGGIQLTPDRLTAAQRNQLTRVTADRRFASDPTNPGLEVWTIWVVLDRSGYAMLHYSAPLMNGGWVDLSAPEE